MVEMRADDYRQRLLRILDNDARQDQVMSLFESNLEVEADNGKAAAYAALSGAGLSPYTAAIDEVSETNSGPGSVRAEHAS